MFARSDILPLAAWIGGSVHMGGQDGARPQGEAGVTEVVTRDHAAQIHEHGYAIVRSVFSADEIGALAAASDRIYARALRHEDGTPAAPGRPEVGFRTVEDPRLGRICRIATWPAHLESLLDRVRVDQRMLAILEPLLGPSLKQITSQLHWKPAGAVRVEFGYHQDIRFRRPRGAYRNTERCFLQTAIAIDPHRSESGAIRLYPGSHRMGDLGLGGEGPVLDQGLSERDLAARGLDPAALIDIELDPGDVALWGLFTVHGSGVNRAGHSRRVYINGYVAAADCDLGTWAFRDGAPCPLGTD
jgi:ectoine hydroxylase-related dioxygenase (phytanoyl-CoA dioxygenase family)